MSNFEKESTTCGFHEAWVGDCKSTDILDNGQCEKHQDMCCMCGEQLATDSCGYCGQFVCGAPVCDDCNHYETHKPVKYCN